MQRQALGAIDAVSGNGQLLRARLVQAGAFLQASASACQLAQGPGNHPQLLALDELMFGLDRRHPGMSRWLPDRLRLEPPLCLDRYRPGGAVGRPPADGRAVMVSTAYRMVQDGPACQQPDSNARSRCSPLPSPGRTRSDERRSQNTCAGRVQAWAAAGYLLPETLWPTASSSTPSPAR